MGSYFKRWGGSEVAKHGRTGKEYAVGALFVAALVVAANVAFGNVVNKGVDAVFDAFKERGQLKVSEQNWPLRPVCDGATSVAMPNNLPGVKDVPMTAIKSDARNWVLENGGAAWGDGTLTLTLSTTHSATAHVLSMTPVIFERSQEPPQWALVTEGGCGDVYARYFDLDLSARKPVLTDRGIVGSPTTDSGEAEPVPVGETFTVSAVDPARITIGAASCSQSAKWGLEIRYTTSDRDPTDIQTLSLGSSAKPFIVLGGTAPAYAIDWEDSSRLTPRPDATDCRE